MQALFPIEHVVLPSLPAASAYPNSVVVVGGVPFFSNGTTWADLTRGRAPFENVATALSIVSNSVAINLALGDFFTLTVSANITSMTLVNPPAAGVVRRILIRVTRDSNGSRTFTLPAGWTAAPHSAPGILTDFVQGANKVTDIEAWTLNGTDWTYFIEPRLAGTGALNNGFVPRFASATDLVNSPLWANSTAAAVGSTSIPTETRFYVYGGASGAHLDVRGEPTSADQAILDLQGSDFDPEARSLFFRYSGINAVGTIAGFAAQNLAEITSAGDTFFIRSLFNVPIRFIVDGVEVFQVTKTGIVSALNITAPNVGGGGSADPLNLIDRPSPGTPAADTVRLFGRKVAGRMLPASIGPSGLDTALQPLIARNKIALFNPPGNSTAAQTIGMAAPNITGAATTANVGTGNIHLAMRRLEYAVTTAAATAVAGARGTVAQYRVGETATPFGGFTFVARFGPSRGVAANATRRFFAGLTSNLAAPTDADPTAGTTWANTIALVADAADVNFHIAHRTGTGAVTKINTGIPKAYADNSEMFELALFSAPTGAASVGYQVTRLSDGLTFAGSITGSLPAATQLLTWQLWSSVGGTNAVVGVAVASVYIETDF